MQNAASAPPADERRRERPDPGARRVVGAYEAGRAGPCLVVIGGIHGNEPAGVYAARRVLSALETRRPALRGRVLALAGNLAALSTGVRYLCRDLNRVWSQAALDELERRPAGADRDETREQRELAAALEPLLAPGRSSRVVLLDLHSTSAPGAPFAILPDTLAARDLALALRVPVILGLEETLNGTLLDHYGQRGCVTLAMEGGQHGLASTVAHHEAAIWKILVASRMLRRRDVPDLARHEARLAEAAEGLPRIVEVVHHQPVASPAAVAARTPGEACDSGSGSSFRMRPGFTNFEPVRAGEVLADCGGVLRAPLDGVLLMPLYQGQGEDGYFIGRRVSRFWLVLSRVLRTLGAGRLLPLAPGVSTHPTRPDVLLVDPARARWHAVDLFHLLGYRRCRPEGTELAFSRRPEPSRAIAPRVGPRSLGGTR